MTRDEAYQIIHNALGHAHNISAAHIATALDALGLLDHCAMSIPAAQRFGLRLHPPGAEVEDISRLAAARVVTGDLLGDAHITAADLPLQPHEQQPPAAPSLETYTAMSAAKRPQLPPETPAASFATESVQPDGLTALGNPAWAAKRVRT